MSTAIASSQAQAETRRIWLKRFMTIHAFLTPQRRSLQTIKSGDRDHCLHISAQV